MIFDRQNMFIYDCPVADLPAESDVIANGAGGNARDTLYLVAAVGGADAPGEIEIVLETADDEAFGEAVTLGTYANLDGEAAVKVKLPYGAKKYLRIKPAVTFADGIFNAGLVTDVDLV